MKKLLLSVCGLLVLTGWLAAQTDLSTIRGVASDPTGAAVPNAKITLTEVETNVSRSTETTSDGVYEIPYLVPGTYRLTATGAGFKTFVAENVLLTSRQTRRIDVAFQLGDISTEVTVSANAAVINTEGSQIAAGFNRATYADNPASISFFPQGIMLTLPNVQAVGAGFTMRFAGQPSAQMVEAMDGVPNDGSVNLVQNMNDFSELQVVGASNSAEFARVSNFSMTGRSGTNDFHGYVMYDLISSALNTRGFFDPAKKPASHYHQGGGNVAGPIRKNRTFFFASYYIERVPGGSYFNRNVPTLAERGGDFSQFATIKDPFTNAPFPGNFIPANRINPLATTVQNNYIPTPNQGAANSITNNFGFLFPHPSDLYKWDSWTDRIDHKISDKNTLYGRYSNRITPYVLAGNFPNVGAWTRTRYHHSVVVSDTHVFSPTLVNTARWGWAKDDIIDGSTVDGFTPVNGNTVVKAIGLQGVNPAGYSAMGFPDFNITGVTELTVTGGGINTLARNFDYADSMTWARGAHVLKFGGELRTFRTFNSTVPTGTYGQFAFNGNMTGNGYADFLLGLPFTSTRLNPIVGRAERSYELGMFVADTWKISRKLTLDYGLRWDYFGTTTYRDGLQYNWDQTTGNVMVPASELKMVSPLYPSTIGVATGQVVPNPSKKNWRPRLGFAYLLDPKTVVRGGYGLYTETQGNFANVQATGPFQLTESFTNNAIVNGAPLFQMPNPYPSGVGAPPSQSISGYPLGIMNGIIQQFNLSLERQVKDIGLRLSYIGSRSSGLHYSVSIDKPQPSLIPFTQSRRPWPQFTGASWLYQDGQAKYDSLQIEGSRKMGILTFEASYTLSNTMENFNDLENPYNHNMWSRDSGIARSRAVLSALIQFPFGKGRRWMNHAPGAVDQVLGGWRLMWTSQFQSGTYFSPSFNSVDPSNTNTVGGLPDCIANGNLPPNQRTPTAWFNPAAFVIPAANIGRFGNCGVNTLQGPGLSSQNATLVKQFRITERINSELSIMGLDLFNSPYFLNPAANISVPGQVARITGLQSSADPGNATTVSQRVFSLRLRVNF